MMLIAFVLDLNLEKIKDQETARSSQLAAQS